MGPTLLRWILLIVLLLTGGAAAAEDGVGSPQASPRDVVPVERPEAVRLGPLPSDFQRVEHGWITLELPSSIGERVPGLLREADGFRALLQESFRQPLLGSVRVRIARDPTQMAELAGPDLGVPAYAEGVAYGPLHFTILSLQAPRTWEAPDLPEVLRHELTHLAVSDAVQGHHLPRWFDEGLAIHESGEGWWGRIEALQSASLSRHFLPLAELDQGFPADGYEVTVAYAESADFVRFLLRDSDRARFASLLGRMRQGAAFERALEDAYGTDLRKLEYEWREDVGHRFSVIPMLTGGGAMWCLIAGLVVVAWLRRRRSAKEKLAEWAREEAEADARAVRPREQLRADEEGDEMPQPLMPGIPVVEHEGRWYTVH